MAETQNKELDAFLAFFSTFNLHRSITTVADLSDGAGLLEILSIMCDDPPTLPCLLTCKNLEMQNTFNRPLVPRRSHPTTGFCVSVP